MSDPGAQAAVRGWLDGLSVSPDARCHEQPEYKRLRALYGPLSREKAYYRHEFRRTQRVERVRSLIAGKHGRAAAFGGSQHIRPCRNGRGYLIGAEYQHVGTGVYSGRMENGEVCRHARDA